MSHSRAPSSRQFSLRTLLILMAIVALLLAIYIGPVRAARIAANQSQAGGNMKQVMLAIHNYADHYKYLPPGVTFTKKGEPAYSWRFAVLPFVDQWGPLESEDGSINRHPGYHVNPSLAWDDPRNLAACRGFVFSLFQRPRVGAKNHNEATNFVVVTGLQTAFPIDRPIVMRDITDDPATTILVVELTPSNIPWYEPRDLPFEEMSFRINDPDRTKPCFGNRELRGAFVGMADGSVRWLPESTPPATIKAMLTIAGGEQVELARH